MQRLRSHVFEEQLIDHYIAPSFYTLYSNSQNHQINLWKYRWIFWRTEFFAQPSNKNKSIKSFTKKKKTRKRSKSHKKGGTKTASVRAVPKKKNTRTGLSILFVSPTAFFNPDPTRSSFLINVCWLGREKSLRISRRRGKKEPSDTIREKSFRFERFEKVYPGGRSDLEAILIEGMLQPLQKWLNSYEATEARRVEIRATRLNGATMTCLHLSAVIIIRHYRPDDTCTRHALPNDTVLYRFTPSLSPP